MPIPVHFSSLIPKMSMFTLAISYLTSPSLPWFMEHFRFLCNIVLTALDFTSITSHICNGVLFLLWLHPFILSGVISPLFSSIILGTYKTGEFIFQCHTFLPFHTVYGVLKARILKWFDVPFSSGPCFVRTLCHDPSTLGGPTWCGLHSFIELDKAVVHVISLVSSLWLWFSVCLPSDG